MMLLSVRVMVLSVILGGGVSTDCTTLFVPVSGSAFIHFGGSGL
jgi:hypothetical protein